MTPGYEFLEDLNLSELAAMAVMFDPGAHRDLGRKALESIIINFQDPSLPERGIDRWRHKIFELCDQHWDQVAPLLSCPMRTRHPLSCFNCTDFQVAECTLLNADKLLPKNRRQK